MYCSFLIAIIHNYVFDIIRLVSIAFIIPDIQIVFQVINVIPSSAVPGYCKPCRPNQMTKDGFGVCVGRGGGVHNFFLNTLALLGGRKRYNIPA